MYGLWIKIHRDFPKVERLGIGNKIEQHFLTVLEFSFTSAYLPPHHKVVVLAKAISRMDVLKFFMQLAWEAKLIPTEKYTELSEKLGEIGRMLGGWKKGLEAKLPPKK